MLKQSIQIYHQTISMSVAKLLSEAVLSGIEKYTLADDPSAYLASLPDSLQRRTIEALLLPYSSALQDELRKAGVPPQLAKQIADRKEQSHIKNATSIEEIQEILKAIKSNFSNSLSFSHKRPVDASQGQSAQNLGSSDQKDLSTFKPIEGVDSWESYFLEAAKRVSTRESFPKLPNFAMRQLPNQFILNLPVELKAIVLSRAELIQTYDSEFLADLMNVFYGEMKRNSLSYELQPNYYLCLSVEQINKLGEKIPDLFSIHAFVEKWFELNYLSSGDQVLTIHNSKLTLEEKDNKRRQLIEVPERFPPSIQQYIPVRGIKRQMFHELLMVDISIEDPSLDRFKEYLSTTDQAIPLFRRNINEKINLDRQTKQPTPIHVSSRLQTCEFRPMQLVEEYLTALLKKYHGQEMKSIDSELLKYLDEASYFRTKAKVCLARGENVSVLKNVLSDSEKQVIKEKRELTIVDSNKSSFKVDEQVVVKIKAKNISEITIKIYELSLEKLYFEGKQEVNEKVDLHCLDPTFQSVHAIDNTDPFKEHVFDLSLKQIKKQRGIYVVDFDGEGLSSRAVIKKGAIFCLKRFTLAGLELKFYDESGKRIEELNLWLFEQKVHIKKSYTIPFGENEQQTTAIAVLGDYAEIVRLKVPAERYNLTLSYFYNPEAFIVGNKAKIVLNPRLTLVTSQKEEPQPMSLKLLKNIRIKVEVVDNEDIKSTITLENVSWSKEEDYVVEVPIKSYVQGISIEGSAEVQCYNGAKQELRFNKIINIAARKSLSNIEQLYLTKRGEDYILQVLGLNGEALGKVGVNLSVLYKWINEIKANYLQSDEKGEIKLGKLSNVLSIAVERNGSGMRAWKIDNSHSTAILLSSSTFRENEKIIVPLPHLPYQLQLGTDISLVRTHRSVLTSIFNENVKINGRYLEISGLSEGNYELRVMSLDAKLLINVIKGTDWEEPGQVYNEKKSIVYELTRSSNHYLMLGDAEIEESEERRKVCVKVVRPEGVKLNANLKAHVFATNFIPSEDYLEATAQYPTLKMKDVRVERFSSKESTYFSNKKLSEEAAYVLNRKNEKQFIGNNLEKPRIFLNRIKVRDTTQNEEQMNQGQEFSKRNLSRERAPDLYDLLDMDAGGYSIEQQRNPQSRVQGQVSCHNNFLGEVGFTLSNVKDEVLSFELPNSYSCFRIVLVSSNSLITQDYHCSDSSKAKQKDLRHLGIRREDDAEVAWAMSREIYPVLEGESVKVNRDSKWCTVSLNNMISYAKTKNITLEDWVSRWPTYPHETKLKTYSKKVCHELNCYIKHHDIEFFNTVVSPYISNKINKTFVDLCLLEDKRCVEWAPTEYFEQLNDFEKVLLIEYLVKRGDSESANRMAESLELTKKTKKQSFHLFKREFETMLNARVQGAYVPPPPPPLPPGVAGFGAAYPPPPPPPPQYGFAPQPERMMMRPQTLFGMAQGRPSSNRGGMESQPYSKMSVRPPQMAMNMMAQPVPRIGMSMMAQPAPSFDFAMQAEGEALMLERETYQQEFKQMQKTEQFTEVTYEGLTSFQEIGTKSLIPQEKFWADLAAYIVKGSKGFENFVTDSILYLTSKREFTLAACFIPKALNAEFQIQVQQDSFQIQAKTSFLLFSKEIKCIPYKPKFGIMVNHRFFDPKDQYTYEDDGTRIEKEAKEFIYRTPYTLQTVVTNISGTSLEVQLLVDIPQGAIPLQASEYTQTVNVTIPAFSTKSFSRLFYFPQEGEFSLYTTSVSWNNLVIGKGAEVPKLVVKKVRQVVELKSFTDVIRSGTSEDILAFLRTKNIFDSNIFDPAKILWMLNEKSTFLEVTRTLRERGFMNASIWKYGILHEDLKTIKEYFALDKRYSPLDQRPLNVFEYFPYYSTRAHKYMNDSKSKIRNVQFKETYYQFLFDQLCYQSEKGANFQLAAAYYLLLQDRIDEAALLLKKTKGEEKNHEIQYDYMACFIDMYQGYPSFNEARKLCEKYSAYPILNWREMFAEISNTLKEYDSAVFVEDSQKAKVEYSTAVFNEGEFVRVSVPTNTKVEVLVFPLNLELFFSENPFQQVESFSAIKPAKEVVLKEGEARDEKIKRDKDLKDGVVHVYSTTQGLPSRKVSSFFWGNPDIKVKLNERKGTLQVFEEGKCVTGCYCKVYSNGRKGIKFYRDGYTDITGTFKYALADLDGITEFSVLSVTASGSIISRVQPPSQTGLLSML